MAKKKRIERVWHILNFEQRFELPDDARKCRKGALLFLKYVVSPSDDESINLAEQLSSLRCMATAEMPDVLLEGCFWRLAKMAANRSRVYRGYLLDEQYRPAAASRIAMWLGLETTTATAVMGCLDRAGLIQRVVMPEFCEEEPDETPPAEPTSPDTGRGKKRQKKQGGKKTAVTGSKTRKKTNSAEGRKIPPPFKKGEDEDKGKPQPSASGEGENETEISLTAAAQGGTAVAVRQGTRKVEPEPEKQAEHKAARQSKGTGQVPTSNRTPSSPTTTPLNLTNLSETDGGAAGAISLHGRLEELYDRTGYVFAERVCRAIGVPYAMDSPQYKSEIGAFAAAWQRALKSGRGPSELNQMYDKIIRRAEHFGRLRAQGRRFKRSPEATLMYEFNQRLVGCNPFKKKKKQDCKAM